jgi:hypothetical protein
MHQVMDYLKATSNTKLVSLVALDQAPPPSGLSLPLLLLTFELRLPSNIPITIRIVLFFIHFCLSTPPPLAGQPRLWDVLLFAMSSHQQQPTGSGANGRHKQVASRSRNRFLIRRDNISARS